MSGQVIFALNVRCLARITLSCRRSVSRHTSWRQNGGVDSNQAEYLENKGVFQGGILESLVAAAHAAVAGVQFGFQQQ